MQTGAQIAQKHVSSGYRHTSCSFTVCSDCAKRVPSVLYTTALLAVLSCSEMVSRHSVMYSAARLLISCCVLACTVRKSLHHHRVARPWRADFAHLHALQRRSKAQRRTTELRARPMLPRLSALPPEAAPMDARERLGNCCAETRARGFMAPARGDPVDTELRLRALCWFMDVRVSVGPAVDGVCRQCC